MAPAAAPGGDLYYEEFVGMTREAVSRNTLADARRRLYADVGSRLKGDIAAFLLSLHDLARSRHLEQTIKVGRIAAA